MRRIFTPGLFGCSLMFTAQAVTAATPAPSDPALSQRMETFMTGLRQALDVHSGMAIVMVDGDRIVYRGNFGDADIEHHVPVTDDTLFYIASATKPLFALAWLQQMGADSLDDSLAGLFPDTRFDPGVHADQVTVRDLLDHSSGLDDETLETAVAITGLHSAASEPPMLARLAPDPAHPRGQFEYTNLGYDVLGMALARPWQDVMKDQVFTPLGMDHTTARASEAAQHGWRVAQPYSYFTENPDAALYLHKQDRTLHPAGGVLSTAGDMARLLEAEMNQGKIDGKPALPAALVALSQQQAIAVDSHKGDFARSGYALGWYIGDYKGERTLHHFGSFDGYRPQLSFMPERRLGLVILDNESELNDRLTDLVADYAYGLMLGESQTDLDARLQARIRALKPQAEGYRQKLLQKEATYRQMPYTMSLPMAAYTGDYCDALAGCVTVTRRDGHFELDWGVLHGTATASGEADRLRVRLRPTRGQFVTFHVEDGAARSLAIGGQAFAKRPASSPADAQAPAQAQGS